MLSNFFYKQNHFFLLCQCYMTTCNILDNDDSYLIVLVSYQSFNREKKNLLQRAKMINLKWLKIFHPPPPKKKVERRDKMYFTDVCLALCTVHCISISILVMLSILISEEEKTPHKPDTHIDK